MEKNAARSARAPAQEWRSGSREQTQNSHWRSWHTRVIRNPSKMGPFVLIGGNGY
jgi:hypothetical protein